MPKQQTKIKGYVTTVTAFIICVITFTMGYLAGTIVTVYKTGSTPSASVGADKNAELESKAKQLEEHLEHNPQDVEALIQLGHVYFDIDKFKKAIDAYERALVIKPDNANVLTDLGVMYRRNDEPEKAVKAFDQAMTVEPRHQQSRFNKGIVLLHDLEDVEGGIKAWEELLKLNPAAKAPSGQSVAELVKHYKGHAPKKPQ